ncbi:Pimeloyl-ACP methyl ester carboxylesterase [Nonomuraea maritima]|uniref:Pimeloyl-ACP methyl ester carboxylesterase n=1 Tax=Nonomuraea maritima TaxID=683260 RepID=A0A1G9CX10_9ACTN|nr:alpha/beta hydrolase [Nonomuraea maritima]SDK56199.1 Pimeloyl-ACP methyl ester carboxylesterase [Nonomuraea maritima]
MNTTTVTSPDGTPIAYHEVGSGPGLVILHGAMQAGRSQIDLARALAADFTCYLPDRRGRGLSGPAGSAYGIQREVEDLGALLRATGSPYAMGVSSGAIITLRTALAEPAALRKIVLFEPPLDVDGSNPTGWLERLDRELAAGRVEAALVTGMKAARLGPPLFGLVPRPVLELLTRMMLRSERRAADKAEPTFGELAPTLREDGRIVAETSGDLETYRQLGTETLLLGGTRSPAYLRQALTALEDVLPRARRADLTGLDHSATSNADRRGHPERVAEEVRRFLTAGS